MFGEGKNQRDRSAGADRWNGGNLVGEKSIEAASPMNAEIHSNDPANPFKKGRKGKEVATVVAAILSKSVVTPAL